MAKKSLHGIFLQDDYPEHRTCNLLHVFIGKSIVSQTRSLLILDVTVKAVLHDATNIHSNVGSHICGQ